MKLSKKAWLLTTLIVIFVITLTGCGGGGGSRNTPEEPSGQITGSGDVVSYDTNVIRQFSGSTCSLSGFENKNIYGAFYFIKQSEGDISEISRITLNISIGSNSPSNLRFFEPPVSKSSLDFQSRLRILERQVIGKSSLKPSKASRYISKVPPVGTQRSFWVSNEDNTFQQVQFTLMKIGTQACFWVDSSETPDMNTINTYDTEFTKIYNIDRNSFGYDTDSDNDPPVYIMITDKIRSFCAGYFYGIDKFANDPNDPVLKNSNAHDMIYITNNKSVTDVEFGKAAMAHEFQHMINFDCHIKYNVLEETWLDESMAELAIYLCGYGDQTDDHIKAYFSSPDVGLTVWNGNINSYGLAALFARYLYEQYPNSIVHISNSDKIGIANVVAATGKQFDYIVHNFFMAVIFDGTSYTTSPYYRFNTLNLREYNDGLRPLPWSTTQHLYPYQLYFTQLTGVDATNNLTLTGGANAIGSLIFLDHGNNL